MINILRHSDSDFASRLMALKSSSSLFDPAIEQRARLIVDAVRDRGDRALIEFTKRFDGADLSPENFPIQTSEKFSASVSASLDLRDSVALAHHNIQTFSRRSLRKDWMGSNAQGGRVGEKFDAFDCVGIYIPGGTAPLVSTALMTVTLAKVAGCKRIVVCTPCNSSGAVNKSLLFALIIAGASDIYRIGGAQAIAAMAFGTDTIPQVQKIFGPGNAYVVAAKRLLFGHVAIDLLPGPSEVLILADESANPRFAAADLLAQAEHGSGHERVWLITTSPKTLKAVDKEIGRQLPGLSRRDYISKALLRNGWLIHVKEMATALALVNELAPEHCEVMTKNAAKLAKEINTAGAIFIGGYSPTVLGDYVAGPSHELPTGGAGRSFAGLTVDQFQRRTSLVEFGKGSLKKSLAAIRKFAEVEGLDAHGHSAEIRLR